MKNADIAAGGRGELVRQFSPPSRLGYLGGCLVCAALAVGAFALAGQFNNAWVVPILAFSALGLGLAAIRSFFKAAGPDPAIGIFERGILIGKKFLGWDEIESVEYKLSFLGTTTKEPHFTWDFRKRNGKRELLAVDGTDYLDAEELNAHLGRKVVLKRR